jgi:hypothetical protein
MDMRAYNGSGFLKVDDLREGPRCEIIAAVEVGQFGKPILIFESGARLSLSVTNNKHLTETLGDDSDGWPGYEIELAIGPILYKGEPVEAIIASTVTKPDEPVRLKGPPPKPAPGAYELGDDDYC